MKTAIEWLMDKLMPSIALQTKYIDELKEQALEMEKQQQGYSEEDMIDFAKFMWLNNNEYKSYQDIFNEWFEKYKKL